MNVAGLFGTSFGAPTLEAKVLLTVDLDMGAMDQLRDTLDQLEAQSLQFMANFGQSGQQAAAGINQVGTAAAQAGDELQKMLDQIAEGGAAAYTALDKNYALIQRATDHEINLTRKKYDLSARLAVNHAKFTEKQAKAAVDAMVTLTGLPADTFKAVLPDLAAKGVTAEELPKELQNILDISRYGKMSPEAYTTKMRLGSRSGRGAIGVLSDVLGTTDLKQFGINTRSFRRRADVFAQRRDYGKIEEMVQAELDRILLPIIGTESPAIGEKPAGSLAQAQEDLDVRSRRENAQKQALSNLARNEHVQMRRRERDDLSLLWDMKQAELAAAGDAGAAAYMAWQTLGPGGGALYGTAKGALQGYVLSGGNPIGALAGAGKGLLSGLSKDLIASAGTAAFLTNMGDPGFRLNRQTGEVYRNPLSPEQQALIDTAGATVDYGIPNGLGATLPYGMDPLDTYMTADGKLPTTSVITDASNTYWQNMINAIRNGTTPAEEAAKRAAGRGYQGAGPTGSAPAPQPGTEAYRRQVQILQSAPIEFGSQEDLDRYRQWRGDREIDRSLNGGMPATPDPAQLPVGWPYNYYYEGQHRIPVRAEGGPVSGKLPYVVGERGPELFVPHSSGLVVPNPDIKPWLQAMGLGRAEGGAVQRGGADLIPVPRRPGDTDESWQRRAEAHARGREAAASAPVIAGGIGSNAEDASREMAMWSHMLAVSTQQLASFIIALHRATEELGRIGGGGGGGGGGTGAGRGGGGRGTYTTGSVAAGTVSPGVTPGTTGAPPSLTTAGFAPVGSSGAPDTAAMVGGASFGMGGGAGAGGGGGFGPYGKPGSEYLTPKQAGGEQAGVITNAPGVASSPYVTEMQSQVARTRKGALSEQTRGWLDYAGRKTGLQAEVYSGGQPASGPNRTGSHRHDLGGAGDLKLRDPVSGRILSDTNPEDRQRMADYVAYATAAGATGVGAGHGYMGSESIHIGGGKETHWGGAKWIADAQARGQSMRAAFAQEMQATPTMEAAAQPGATATASAPATDVAPPAQSAQAFLGGDVSRFPAGMRNNNPGNLKYQNVGWVGSTGPSTNTDQGDFQETFSSPQAGMNAAARLAYNKYTKRGLTTLNSIMGDPQYGWTSSNPAAPGNLARTMGIDPNADLNLTDPAKLQSFLKAMVVQEHGAASAAYTDEMYRLASARATGVGVTPAASAATPATAAATTARNLDMANQLAKQARERSRARGAGAEPGATVGTSDASDTMIEDSRIIARAQQERWLAEQEAKAKAVEAARPIEPEPEPSALSEADRAVVERARERSAKAASVGQGANISGAALDDLSGPIPKEHMDALLWKSMQGDTPGIDPYKFGDPLRVKRPEVTPERTGAMFGDTAFGYTAPGAVAARAREQRAKQAAEQYTREQRAKEAAAPTPVPPPKPMVGTELAERAAGPAGATEREADRSLGRGMSIRVMGQPRRSPEGVAAKHLVGADAKEIDRSLVAAGQVGATQREIDRSLNAGRVGATAREIDRSLNAASRSQTARARGGGQVPYGGAAGGAWRNPLDMMGGGGLPFGPGGFNFGGGGFGGGFNPFALLGSLFGGGGRNPMDMIGGMMGMAGGMGMRNPMDMLGGMAQPLQLGRGAVDVALKLDKGLSAVMPNIRNSPNFDIGVNIDRIGAPTISRPGDPSFPAGMAPFG